MSLIRDPEAYERFEKVVLFHGVRTVSELAYQEYISKELHDDEFLGEMVRDKLLYYPSVTREPYRNQGRLTDLITTNKMTDDLGLEPLNPETDRVMICGSPSMNKDTADLLEERGFKISPSVGVPGDYVIERAFVER
jgi:ferredoxin--NADP+ reductase